LPRTAQGGILDRHREPATHSVAGRTSDLTRYSLVVEIVVAVSHWRASAKRIK
jgi:hypothetical protein